MPILSICLLKGQWSVITPTVRFMVTQFVGSRELVPFLFLCCSRDWGFRVKGFDYIQSKWGNRNYYSLQNVGYCKFHFSPCQFIRNVVFDDVPISWKIWMHRNFMNKFTIFMEKKRCWYNVLQGSDLSFNQSEWWEFQGKFRNSARIVSLSSRLWALLEECCNCLSRWLDRFQYFVW